MSLVTLFGGAFDPPHIGHSQVASYLLEQKISDEVWFVPVKQHPFGKEVTADQHRLAMLDLILQPGLRTETYELEHPHISYSAWTLAALTSQYPQHNFAWIIGSDNLEYFHKWGGDIFAALEKYTFYVYPRAGFPLEPLYPGMISLPSAPVVKATSTDIRQRVNQNQSISGLVDPKIEGYIKKHHLYQ